MKQHRKSLGAIGLAVAVMASPPAPAQVSFSDVSAAARVDWRGESYGASWGDLNGDGYLDIFASNHRQRPSLYLNRGNGTFFDTGPQVRTWRDQQRADTHGGSFADVDGDGDEDLLVSTGTGNLSQYLINENQRLVNRTVERGLNIANVGGRLPVWLDYDRDDRLDFVMTQYGGIAKLFRQDAQGRFTETTSLAKLVCNRFHYAHLYDVNDDGRLEFLCAAEKKFPQKIYDTLPMPWQKLFDSASPNGRFPVVGQVADSIVADFDNDGRLDMFVLANVQLRPSSVVQGSATHFEAKLTGGDKGFRFVTTGTVTIDPQWNKTDEGTPQELTRIQIGAGARSPRATPFTLDPADPTVVGMPPLPATKSDLPVIQIGYEPAAKRWTFVHRTTLNGQVIQGINSEAYVLVDTESAVSSLVSTGLWPSDKPQKPLLLMNYSGGYSDQTAAAGLDAPVQCASVTAGDFDNDTDVDLYLACRTGASNIPNILYLNQGNGTFVPAPGAAGAAGPVGIAVASGAGTADTAISGDYDADGFLDLFVTNGFNLRPLETGGSNKLFRNSGNGKSWVQLDLVAKATVRDAVGARVHATAAGKTQLRVQDGGYHRWSQEPRRLHFGLGGAATVDLRVEWPSGTVQTFNDVAADRIYRITEGAGIARVALGDAPPYQCGQPSFDGARDAALFIWQDCPTGEWRMKVTSAGATINYQGTVTSTAAFVSVKNVGLEGDDVVNSTSDPRRISFSFVSKGTGSDGVNFLAKEGASACLSVTAPTGARVLYGPFRAPISEPINLDTRAPCTP
jgi:hypothetical protein